MPKVKVDYSNTIFYKIFCKDSSVKELYIGHTTNFVQRKCAHKQGCINPKSANYKCKVYKTIRDNMGWENWTMEIIAFHNCNDLYSAKKLEQHYFEEYKATLNSVEPLPPRKPKKEVVVKPKKEVFYCDSCRVYFNTRKLQEDHNKRPRHIKMMHNKTELIHKSMTMFECEKCNYTCSKKSDYLKHCKTIKHTQLTTGLQPNTSQTVYICSCGKEYNHRASLWNHKQNCKGVDQEQSQSISVDSSLVIELLKQNQEFKEMMMEQHKKITEQYDTIIGLSTKR